MAQDAFNVFKDMKSDTYYAAVKSWEVHWDNLTTFLHYPLEI